MTDNRIWVLGAPDPEMELIERVLRECGETVVYAADARGERVTPATAYRGESLITNAGYHPCTSGVTTVYLVECDLLDDETTADFAPWEKKCHPELEGRTVRRIDHHRPGDPGYGRPPEEFLPASSIGQVISELARLGRLPMGPCVSTYEWVGNWEERQRAAFRWFHWEAEARTAFSGGTLFERFQTPYRLAPCDGYYIFARRVSGVVEFTASEDEMRDAGAVRVASDKIVRVHIPHDLVLAAAADHCLAHAYAGRCPGVDPDDLMRWRVETRASHQSRSVDDVLADVEAAREALRRAKPISLTARPNCTRCNGSGMYYDAHGDDSASGQQTEDGYAVCPCGGYEPQWAADLRGQHVPELPEASAREGECFVADGLPGPDGRVKIVCQSGTLEEIEAFMRVWAPAHGLTDIYGDPARGFAGGYVEEVK